MDKHTDKLPHWQQGHAYVFVTWRLADSLPQAKIIKWKEEKERWVSFNPKPWDLATESKYYERFGQTMDHWLDAGYGSCLLENHENGKIVSDALLHFNHQRYNLSDFVIMPNHVHVLFQPLECHKLENIIKTWKQYTAKEINLRRGMQGALWQKNYWDRLIRSQEHFDWTRNYIHNNPQNLAAEKYFLWSGDL